MPSPLALAVLDRLRYTSDLHFTSRGDALLATVRNATSVQGAANPSRIWRFDAQGAQRLTDGPHSDSQALPSPLDERIAFLSDRACLGRNAVYLLAPDGAVRPVGDVPGTVEQLRWSADGSSLVVLAADRGLSGGATQAAVPLWWGGPAQSESVLPGTARRRLFRIWLDDGRTEEVGPRAGSVWEFALVPDGAVAVLSDDAGERGWHHARLVRIDFRQRAVRVLHTSAWQLQGLAVDPGGSKVAFVEGWSSDRGLLAGEMSVLDLASGRVSRLAREQQSNVTWLAWRDAGSLWFAGWQRLGTVYGVVGTDGAIEWQRHEDATLGESGYSARLTVAADGKKMAAVREALAAPPEIVWKSGIDQDWSPVSALNAEVAASYPCYPEVRQVAWQGSDGVALEALVLLPRDRGGMPPMIVDIHGGPCYATKHSFNPGGALAYAAAGFAVFLPNYRGNVGWGQAHSRLNLGDPAGAEFDDILAGVDHCISLGYGDPERLGVTGSSYGGYLTNWAVATTTRFKAAVPVSSIASHHSCHYSCEHDFHPFIVGGPLTEAANLRLANERSPLLKLAHPRTPTLLIHGREDRCTPVSEALQFHTALRERGVTTELAIYPFEGHGAFRDRARRMDGWRRRIAWFERFLLDCEVAA